MELPKAWRRRAAALACLACAVAAAAALARGRARAAPTVQRRAQTRALLSKHHRHHAEAPLAPAPAPAAPASGPRNLRLLYCITAYDRKQHVHLLQMMGSVVSMCEGGLRVELVLYTADSNPYTAAQELEMRALLGGCSGHFGGSVDFVLKEEPAAVPKSRVFRRNLSSSVASTSIRPIFGRIDRSRRGLEARQKASRRLRSHRSRVEDSRSAQARGPQVRHDDAAPPRDAQEAPGLRPLPLRRGRRPRRIEARARLLRRELAARGRAGRPQVRPRLAALREERHRRAPAPRHAPRRRGRPRASRRVARRRRDRRPRRGAGHVGERRRQLPRRRGRRAALRDHGQPPRGRLDGARRRRFSRSRGTAPRRRRARSSGSTTSSATSSTCPRPRGPSRASAPAAGTST